MLAVVAVGLLVVQRQAADDARGERDDLAATAATERDARLAAAQFGEAFFTFDFRDMEATTATILSMVTDEYAENFEANRIPGLNDLFASAQISTTATTEQVYLGQVSDGHVQAVAVVDVLGGDELASRDIAEPAAPPRPPAGGRRVVGRRGQHPPAGDRRPRRGAHRRFDHHDDDDLPRPARGALLAADPGVAGGADALVVVAAAGVERVVPVPPSR